LEVNCVKSIKSLLAAILLVVYTSMAMTGEVEVLVLDEGPPASDGPGATPLQLYEEQQTMGIGSLDVPELEVTVAEPRLFALSGQKAAAARTGSTAYYLVRFPFTVHEPTEGRRVYRLELHVGMEVPDVVGFQLIPDQIVTEQDVERVVNLSAALKRAGIDFGGGLSYGITYKRYLPSVLSYGEGEPSFYWVFERQNTGLPLLGSLSTWVVLRVDGDTKDVKGKLRLTALMDRRFPFMGTVTVVSQDRIAWDLTEAEPFDEVPSTRVVVDGSQFGNLTH
jgi:hypothetical protein